ncbi:MAG: pilus assembly protein PilM [Lachnospiraceae bacterium]|nr:pilus assembly protein PilM [Lachnospiraceae bacterium]
MANKIICIEVGSSVTKICEMDFRTKNPKVYKYCTIQTPEGVYDDGFIDENPAFALSVKQAIQFNKMKSKQVVCTITSSKIATREVIIPSVKKNQVEALIEANASEYFPINLNDYELGHLVLENIKDEDGSSKLKVLVMACNKQLIKTYDNLCNACGLHLVSVDFTGNSVYQVMKNEIKDEVEMVIKVEDKNSIATIMTSTNMIMQRNFSYGIENAVYTLMNSSAFTQKTYEEAMEELRRITCIRLVLNENTVMIEKEEDAPEVSEKVARAMGEITEALAPLIGNVSRVLDLYNSKNSDNPVKKIRLIGLGAEISGLSKLITNEIGVKTLVCENIHSIGWNQSAGLGSSGRYVATIGAGIAPIGFINEEKKKSDISDVNYRNIAIIAVLAALVVCGSLYFFGFSELESAKAKGKVLEKLYATYAPAEVVYNEYNATKELHDSVMVGVSMTDSYNDSLLDFLDKLEKNLPSDAEVVKFQSNCTDSASQVATVKVRVYSLEEGAKILDVMRSVCPEDSITVTNIETEEMTMPEYRDLLVALGVIDKEKADKFSEELTELLGEDGLLVTKFEQEDGEELEVPDYFYVYEFFVGYGVNKSTDESVGQEGK